MPQVTVNPYVEIGTYIQPGLDSIVASFSAGTTPAISDLVDAVYNFIQPTFYSTSISRQVEIEIKSVARTAINSYVNNLVLRGNGTYDEAQMPLISRLIGMSMTSNIPLNSISDRISDVEDNVSKSGLSVEEQRPILLACTIGEAVYSYWAAQIGATLPPPIPPPMTWPMYFPSQTQNAENYIYLSYWVEAAMNGSFSAYGANLSGLIEPTINVMSTNMISSLIGALTITAGKVLFAWIPRIQNQNQGQLNAQTVTDLNSLLRESNKILGVYHKPKGSGCSNNCSGCYSDYQSTNNCSTNDCQPQTNSSWD